MSTQPMVRVHDVMKRHIDIVQGQTSVAEALRTMKHVDTKCLIVDRRHPEDEYGIVMLSDIARRVLAVNRAPERVDIYEIMSKPVLTVSPTMDIRYCARLFDKFGLSRAPVAQRSEIIGLVSYTDLVLKGMCRAL